MPQSCLCISRATLALHPLTQSSVLTRFIVAEVRVVVHDRWAGEQLPVARLVARQRRADVSVERQLPLASRLRRIIHVQGARIRQDRLGALGERERNRKRNEEERGKVTP